MYIEDFLTQNNDAKIVIIFQPCLLIFISSMFFFWKTYTKKASFYPCFLPKSVNIFVTIFSAGFCFMYFFRFSFSLSCTSSLSAYFIFSSKSSSFFKRIPSPFSSKYSAFSSSCPGIGFIIKIGVPRNKSFLGGYSSVVLL